MVVVVVIGQGNQSTSQTACILEDMGIGKASVELG